MPHCFPQHLSKAAWGLEACGRERSRSHGEAASLQFCFLTLSSHYLGAEEKKSLSLPPFVLSSQCEFFCLPSSASQRQVISQHDVLCCEFSTRHASSPPLPLHRHNFFETHCAALSKYWRQIKQIVERRSCPGC